MANPHHKNKQIQKKEPFERTTKIEKKLPIKISEEFGLEGRENKWYKTLSHTKT